MQPKLDSVEPFSSDVKEPASVEEQDSEEEESTASEYSTRTEDCTESEDDVDEEVETSCLEEETVPPHFFVSPSDDVYFLCCVFLGYFLGAIYAPHTIPSILGPIAYIAQDLSASYNGVLKAILFGGLIVHAIEGFIAVYLCRQKKINLVPTLKWWVQTTILGFFSLRLLIKGPSAASKKKK